MDARQDTLKKCTILEMKRLIASVPVNPFVSHSQSQRSVIRNERAGIRCGVRVPVVVEAMKRILITERAKEVLLIMADGADISEWIMNEWDGYCEVHGEPDFEVG